MSDRGPLRNGPMASAICHYKHDSYAKGLDQKAGAYYWAYLNCKCVDLYTIFNKFFILVFLKIVETENDFFILAMSFYLTNRKISMNFKSTIVFRTVI